MKKNKKNARWNQRLQDIFQVFHLTQLLGGTMLSTVKANSYYGLLSRKCGLQEQILDTLTQ